MQKVVVWVSLEASSGLNDIIMVIMGQSRWDCPYEINWHHNYLQERKKSRLVYWVHMEANAKITLVLLSSGDGLLSFYGDTEHRITSKDVQL